MYSRYLSTPFQNIAQPMRPSPLCLAHATVSESNRVETGTKEAGREMSHSAAAGLKGAGQEGGHGVGQREKKDLPPPLCCAVSRTLRTAGSGRHAQRGSNQPCGDFPQSPQQVLQSGTTTGEDRAHPPPPRRGGEGLFSAQGEKKNVHFFL